MVNSSRSYSILWLSLLGLFALHSLHGCKDSSPQTQPEEALETIQMFGQTPFIFPVLSPEAQDIITDWPVFKDFKRISGNLVNIPVEDMKYRSNNLRLQSDSLAVTLPKALESPIVRARLLVVSTRINLLNQETKKSVPDSTVVENRLLELHQSIREFILHINEKIEKDRLDQQGVNQSKLTP